MTIWLCMGISNMVFCVHFQSNYLRINKSIDYDGLLLCVYVKNLECSEQSCIHANTLGHFGVYNRGLQM